MIRVKALYGFFLRRQLSLGRVGLFGGLGVIALVAAVAINQAAAESEQIPSSVRFTFVFGLSLMVPVVSLVLSASSLGELVDDETLVYLWHRPSPRWMMAFAAWAASFSIALPFTLIPLTVAGAVASSADGEVIIGIITAVTLAALAYSALFVLAGLIFRRALIWGLMYLFIWELFVSKAGVGAARLSIGSYPASLLADVTSVRLPRADRGLAASVVVPIVVAVVALALTSWRLDRAQVS